MVLNLLCQWLKGNCWNQMVIVLAFQIIVSLNDCQSRQIILCKCFVLFGLQRSDSREKAGKARAFKTFIFV